MYTYMCTCTPITYHIIRPQDPVLLKCPCIMYNNSFIWIQA
uniref:Uncharacterized protein n=1 Tax=Anguilla anguilla TaxID=7936 RepID=A0A0E9R7C1_ANGAN